MVGVSCRCAAGVCLLDLRAGPPVARTDRDTASQGGALAAGQAAESAANGPCRGADLRTGGAKPASGSETLAGGVGGESTNQPGRSANISSLEVAPCVRDVQGAQQSGADGPSVSGARRSPARQGDAQFVLLSNLLTHDVATVKRYWITFDCRVGIRRCSPCPWTATPSSFQPSACEVWITHGYHSERSIPLNARTGFRSGKLFLQPLNFVGQHDRQHRFGVVARSADRFEFDVAARVFVGANGNGEPHGG